MLITEMISALQAVKAEHGDIPVCSEHEGSYYLVERLDDIEEGVYEHSPYDHAKRCGIRKEGKFLCL